MSEVCKETPLTSLSGEELQGRATNNSNDARVDIRTGSFLGARAAGNFRLKSF